MLRLVRRGTAILGIAVVLGSVAAVSAQTFEDPLFTAETVATLPAFRAVDLAWAPDGDLFVLQRDGVVRVVVDGQVEPTPFIDLSGQVNTYLDRGMLGIALHPDFDLNGWVYLSYVHEPGGNVTDAGPKLGRIVRVTADPSNHHVALPGSEVVLIGDLPATAGSHTVGGLRFASDGRLFAGFGDGSNASRNQIGAVDALSLDSYRGKLLRLNDDGSAPGDNPFDDGSNSIRSKIWALGLRNPFRFALHPGTEEPFIGDVGWDDWEEIDHGPAGTNFGWPCYEGDGPQEFHSVDFADTCVLYPPAAVRAPVFTYAHTDLPPVPDAIVAGDSVTAGTFYTGGVYPPEYDGSFFFTDYVAGWVLRMDVDAAGNVTGVHPFAADLDSPVAIEQGPDGLLYTVSFVSGEIRRIRYLGPSAAAAAAPTYGYSPLPVTFSSAGSADSQGGPLSYLWEFGDGATSTEPDPAHTYVSSAVETFTARLTVSTETESTATAQVPIIVNSAPPTAQILNPPVGKQVLPGETVSFSGMAVDPDEGGLPGSSLNWTVLLHHDTHVHTVLTSVGANGSFRAEYHGTGIYSYELELRAIDASGLSGTALRSIELLPDTTPPTEPGSLAAVPVGPGRIDLAWVASTDLGGVAGYRVERCAGASCSSFEPIAATTDSGLADGGLASQALYRYRVRALDTSGNLGSYSGIAEAATPAGAGPIGLVAAFHFDEGAGSIAHDVTGHGHDGVISGAAWSAAGRNGGALSFDGVNDLVALSPSSALDFPSGLTTESWVRPSDALTGWATVVQHAVDDYVLHASHTANPMHPVGGVTAGGILQWVAAPSAIPVGAWSHLASTYDGTMLRLYVDGQEVQNRSVSGAIQVSSNPVRFGGNVPYGEFFKGEIDDIRIYDRALTPSEILADMGSPVLPAAVGPPAVPSGTTGSGMIVAKADPSGGQLVVTWDDTSCSGPFGHRLIYGGGSQLPRGGGSFGVAGVDCSAASPFAWSAPATTIDPSGLVWWVVVAADAEAIEGSWGTATGGERSGPGPGGSSGACGTPGKSLSNTCGR